MFTEFFNAAIEGDLEGILKLKTPHYRVIPAEPTITPSSELNTIDINLNVPPPGEVAPIDIITEMLKDVSLIGVAQCFCRLTKQQLGEGCDAPLETCFVCNDLAQTLIKYGAAREIDYEEAVQILMDCEAKGLVHNIDNCSSDIRTICNCCNCCCIVLKSMQRGENFAGSPSRYVAHFDTAKCHNCLVCVSRCPTSARQEKDGTVIYDNKDCLGCGLCVTTCPEGANSMVLRAKQHKIPASYDKLSSKIRREAMFSILKKKLFKT